MRTPYRIVKECRRLYGNVLPKRGISNLSNQIKQYEKNKKQAKKIYNNKEKVKGAKKVVKPKLSRTKELAMPLVR